MAELDLIERIRSGLPDAIELDEREEAILDLASVGADRPGNGWTGTQPEFPTDIAYSDSPAASRASAGSR